MKDLSKMIKMRTKRTNKKHPSSKRWQGFFNGFLSCFIVVFLVFSIFLVIQSNRGKCVTVLGYTALGVITGSMTPTLEEGDYILVRWVEARQLKVGDIISFYSEDPQLKDRIVTHRIIGITADQKFETMGDANTAPDQALVSPERVIGKYEKKLTYLRLLVSFKDRRKALMILVIIPICFLSIYELNSLAQLVSKLRREESQNRENSKEYEERVEKIKKEAIEEYLKNHPDQPGKPGQPGQTDQAEQPGQPGQLEEKDD